MDTFSSSDSRRPRIARWIVSGVVLLGGLLLVSNRTSVPLVARDPHGPESGRGEPSTPPSAQAAAHGFETEDMSARDMTWLVFSLGASVAVSIGILLLMLTYFHSRNEAAQPRLTPEQQAQIEPPAPGLQANPADELRQQRAREGALLHGYAWLDSNHTRARIPIDRAMALTVGQSLDKAP
ncbi:hypothetical protein [Rhodopila sp.]|uniref:hypothetical protein n=1 Tax=Rhodopila sp. TaxID=2480087 RepID=UPI003D14D6FD